MVAGHGGVPGFHRGSQRGVRTADRCQPVDLLLVGRLTEDAVGPTELARTLGPSPGPRRAVGAWAGSSASERFGERYRIAPDEVLLVAPDSSRRSRQRERWCHGWRTRGAAPRRAAGRRSAGRGRSCRDRGPRRCRTARSARRSHRSPRRGRVARRRTRRSRRARRGTSAVEPRRESSPGAIPWNRWSANPSNPRMTPPCWMLPVAVEELEPRPARCRAAAPSPTTSRSQSASTATASSFRNTSTSAPLAAAATLFTRGVVERLVPPLHLEVEAERLGLGLVPGLVVRRAAAVVDDPHAQTAGSRWTPTTRARPSSAVGCGASG